MASCQAGDPAAPRVPWRAGLLGLIALVLALAGGFGGHVAAVRGRLAWQPNIAAAKTCTKTVTEPYTAHKTVTESYACTKTVYRTESVQESYTVYVSHTRCHEVGSGKHRHRACSTTQVPETRYRTVTKTVPVTEHTTCTRRVTKAYTAYKTVTKTVACATSSGFGGGDSSGGVSVQPHNNQGNSDTGVLSAKSKTNPASECKRTASGKLRAGDPGYCEAGVTYDCTGVDEGCRANGKEIVKYPSSCPQQSVAISCSSDACNTLAGTTPGELQVNNEKAIEACQQSINCDAPSQLVACAANGEGWFQPYTYCYDGAHHSTVIKSGAEKEAPASSCDHTPKAKTCTPDGTLTRHFIGCTASCHTGWFDYTNSCGSVMNTTTGVKTSCTAGCVSHTTTKKAPACTPDGTLTRQFVGCVSNGVGEFAYVNSCGTVESTHDGAATRCDTGGSKATSANNPGAGGSSGGSGASTGGGSGAPSCTPSTSSAPIGSQFTPTGCTGDGVEIGVLTQTVQVCTTSATCHTSCTDTTSSTVTTEPTASQCRPETLYPHACWQYHPGYREVEHCFTFYGQAANCTITGEYDPKNCPVPVGVG